MSNYLSPSQDGGKKRTNQLNDTNRKRKENGSFMIKVAQGQPSEPLFPSHLSSDCSPSREIKGANPPWNGKSEGIYSKYPY